jgi:hypothetical protein
LRWDESAVGALVLRVSRSERLGRALAFLWLQRRRDKLRAQQQRAEEEQRKRIMETSLGVLAGAKSSAKKPATAAAAAAVATTTTPGSSNNSPNHATSQSHTSLLLSLPDYAASPYALAAVPLAPPESVPSALLSVDSALANLRHTCVPARVTEETFWNTYFAHVQDELQAYLTHASRAQQQVTQQ